MAERGKFCIDFWEAFRTHAAANPAFIKEFKLRRSHKHSWYDLAVGKSNCHISMNVQPSKSTIDIGIYIPDDKKYYAELSAQAEEIAAMFDCQLEWREAQKACRILTTKTIDPTRAENLPIIFEWYINLAHIFKKVTRL